MREELVGLVIKKETAALNVIIAKSGTSGGHLPALWIALVQMMISWGGERLGPVLRLSLGNRCRFLQRVQ